MQRQSFSSGIGALLSIGLTSATACSGGHAPSPSTAASPSDGSSTKPETSNGHAAKARGKPVPVAPEPSSSHAKKISIAEARKRMVELINRDRATQGLSPVTLDDGAAQTAGQRHAEDMAKHGFLGHWGSDGSVPEQRYTESGGSDFMMENAACVTDEKARELDPSPMIDIEALENTESMFFNETPPNDGHRKNILSPQHKKVGIGISQAKATATELPGLCLTQEFVDPYGSYGALPKQAKVGATVKVSGAVSGPAKFGGVGVSRIELPKPIAVGELNRRRSYPMPEPYEVYWPKGFKTSIPVQISGSNFSIEIPFAKGPGLYAISIMGQYPGQKHFGMISLRTIEVR